MRPEDEARKLNKGQHAYGEKRQKGKTEDHLRELATLDKIQELRNLGHSYWKIADILNAMKVPIKTRRAGWKAATVMGILKRAESSKTDLIAQA